MLSKLFLPYIIKRKNSKNDLTYEKIIFSFYLHIPIRPSATAIVFILIEIHPVRGGGRAGGGDGGSVRHRSRLGVPEQGGGLQRAINDRAFIVCTQSVGSPPPWGEGARDGCGRQPLAERGTAGGACAVGPAATRPARGCRLRPIWVGQRGDLQGAIIGGVFVVCALEKSTPLGVGGGLAGAMAAPSATAPALELPSRAGACRGL